MRSTFLVLLILLGSHLTASAEESVPFGDASADIMTVCRDLLVSTKLGEVVRTEADGRVTLALDAMTFQIHSPDRLGRLQAAHAELGPNLGGAVLEFETLIEPYAGPMELPQTLSGPYYDTHCAQVQERTQVRFVRARFGADFPAEPQRRILGKLGFDLEGKPPTAAPVPDGKPGR